MTAVAEKKSIDPVFGRRLREFRLAAGLTQAELGQAVDMLPHAIGRLESGGREPGWGTVCKLADALNKSPNDFRADGGAG